MRKKRIWAAAVAVVLTALAAALVSAGNRLPGWETPEGISGARGRKIEASLAAAAEECADLYASVREASDHLQGACLTRSDIDAIEARLIDAGYATVDSDPVYPEYLANPEALYRFQSDLSAGENASFPFFRVSEDGGLWQSCFLREQGETRCVLTKLTWDNGVPRVESCEVRPVYDMELADWGIFYYRLYPADDPHYIDYSQLRLAPVDRTLYDLNRTYILPVGYQMVNLFLCDWQEGDWGDLSFNDLFEYLREMDTGERFQWSDLPDWISATRAILPAGLFEDTLLAHFHISREELRGQAGYDPDRDGYPWRPVFGDDLTTWHYPMCQPEVVKQVSNADGTVTLTVRVFCPELKTDRLFTHEVTVRPLAEGGFQYTGNRVTQVGSRGLPPAIPRFQLDG